MFEVKCPAQYNPNTPAPSIFLAGGISNCWDWQTYAVDKLSDLDVVLINPRRDNFDINDPNMARQQIEWEYNYLQQASAILFYFSHETVCPITLYELGVYAKPSNKQIFVAHHLYYERRLDIEVQLGLINPSIHVYNSLDNMLGKIKHHYSK